MTSKDCLDLLMSNQKKVKNGFEFINLKIKERTTIAECYEIIEKDLEILDILKNNLYEEKGTGRFKGCNTINCSLGNQHSGIDYTKVKEWLENGKIL